MAASIHTTITSAFHVGSVPTPTPHLEPESIAALDRLSCCPRLSAAAPRFTTDEVLAILGDTPARKRRGTLRAIIVRHVSRFDGADFGLLPAIV